MCAEYVRDLLTRAFLNFFIYNYSWCHWNGVKISVGDTSKAVKTVPINIGRKMDIKGFKDTERVNLKHCFVEIGGLKTR